MEGSGKGGGEYTGAEGFFELKDVFGSEELANLFPCPQNSQNGRE